MDQKMIVSGRELVCRLLWLLEDRLSFHHISLLSGHTIPTFLIPNRENSYCDSDVAMICETHLLIEALEKSNLSGHITGGNLDEEFFFDILSYSL